MSTDDRNDGFDELLRRTMNDEAETIVPAGDGLSRIQQRVAVRRARLRWLRPTLAMGSAAVVAAGVIGGLAIAKNGNTAKLSPTNPPPSSSAPSPTESPTPSVSPTTEPVSNEAFPARGFFPFTNATDEKTWEQQFAQGSQPWIADPTEVATLWVTNDLGYPTVSQVVQNESPPDNSTADVTLGFKPTSEGNAVHPVTVVHLVHFGHAWIVTGASDPRGNLAIASPKAGALARSPLTVTGPAYGIDEAAEVTVRDATSATVFGVGHTGSFGGSGAKWSAPVDFTQPPGSVGVLLVVDHGAADNGGPLAMTAEQVTFGEASSGQAYPPYFYAINNGKVTKFSTHDGESIEFLTNDTAGGGASDPQLSDVGSQVYYLQGGGTCVNTLMAVTTDSTHTTDRIASPDSGYVITGYAVGPASQAADGGASPGLALYEKACDGSRSPQAKLVLTANGTTRSISYPSVPPGIVADPSFVPGSTTSFDVRYLDAFVKSGMSGYLAKYDIANDTSPTPSRNACPGWDVNTGLPAALETTDAELWFAVQTGASMQVVQCAGQHASVAFTVHQNNTPGDVDVTSNGAAVLLTDIDGHVWLWDNTGAPRQLHPRVPLTQVTW